MATKKKPAAKKKTAAKKTATRKKTATKEKPDANAAFAALHSILAGVAKSSDLVVNHDHATGMQVNSKRHIYKGAPLFFGGLAKKKSYTSYYLMGVYIWPDLLDDMSPALKKRMQGKSCFNFKDVDDALFKELAALTKKTHKAYATRALPAGLAS